LNTVDDKAMVGQMWPFLCSVDLNIKVVVIRCFDECVCLAFVNMESQSTFNTILIDFANIGLR
jgi:hypothetical protein